MMPPLMSKVTPSLLNTAEHTTTHTCTEQQLKCSAKLVVF